MFWKRKKKRVIVLGLDGFPCSLARDLIQKGLTPNLRAMAEKGSLSRIHSVYPTVSNVAWASFQTGCNPGEFGVFGFAELDPHLRLVIPNAADLKTPTMWERLSAAGKRIVSLGVPLSYPPKPVNGYIVGGFLSPSLEKAVADERLLGALRDRGYMVDIDPMKARESLDFFKEELQQALAGRLHALKYFLQDQEWDMLCLHVMETDRLNHFMWRFLDEGGDNGEFFLNFYGKVDALVGEAMNACRRSDVLIVLSDHGFCRVRSAVQLNRWLREEGLLKFAAAPSEAALFEGVSPASKALSLVPGRIHILTPSFWNQGSVRTSEYEPVRDELISRLRELKGPVDGQPVCKQIFTKQDAYHGEHTERAPDIIVDPMEGYDLKAAVSPGDVFSDDVISGMHTFDDAFICVRGNVGDTLPKNITEAGRLVEQLTSGL